MLQCWHENPKQRPSFTKLRETFEALLSECEGYIDFDKIKEDSVYYTVPSFDSHTNEEIDIDSGEMENRSDTQC